MLLYIRAICVILSQTETMQVSVDYSFPFSSSSPKKTNHRFFVPFAANLQSKLFWSSLQPCLLAASSPCSREADGLVWAKCASLARGDVLFKHRLLPWCLHIDELSKVMLSKWRALLSPSINRDQIRDEHLHCCAWFPHLMCQPLVLPLWFVLSADCLDWWRIALLPLASITVLHACAKKFILPLAPKLPPFSQEPGWNFPMSTFFFFFFSFPFLILSLSFSGCSLLVNY